MKKKKELLTVYVVYFNIDGFGLLRSNDMPKAFRTKKLAQDAIDEHGNSDNCVYFIKKFVEAK